MGVSVRFADDAWYVFVRHDGDRLAQKCVSEDHAKKTQEAVITAIAAGQFDIAAMKKKRRAPREAGEEKPKTPTLSEFFDKTMERLWRSSLAPATFSRYEGSFRCHILPLL